MTTSRKQAAAVSAAGLIAAGLWYWTTAGQSPDVEFSHFTRLAPRPFRARLPGGLPYRPATDASRTAPNGTPVDLPAEVRLAAAQVELAADVSAEARVQAATVRLLLGDIAGALSRADAADPNSLRADASVLRSAAHLARYEENGDPVDAASGLDWALRALDRDSNLEEARHNVGLAFSYLGPPRLAIQSWSGASTAARSEDWRREAEANASALSSETDREARVSQFVESWEGSRSFSAHQVRAAPDLVREVFERTVVPSWIWSLLAGQTTQVPTDAVRAVARTLVDRTSDRQPLDTIDVIVRACGAELASCKQIARLYQHYVEGRIAWDANRYGEAYAHFDRVVAQSATPRLPESGWANIHLGLRDYYAGRFAAARRRAADALGQARGKGYVATAGRAA